MGQAADREGAAADVDALFDHSAFAACKSRASAFVVVRPLSREVVWANAAAEAFWRRPAEHLATALFGPPGRGWLGHALAAIVPGRAPQMLRTGLSPGLGMQGRIVLARAVAAPDGTPIVGLAVPGPAGDPVAPETWRQGTSLLAAGAAVPEEGTSALAEAPDLLVAGDAAAPDGDLARRSQLAVLRDRLAAALDGAATVRFLWRTDARGALTRIDETLMTRLGTPLAAGGPPLPEAIGRFDPAAGERLAAAFASGASWSGLPVRLPVAGGLAVVPALVSGSPVFGRARGFEGYRGFGIVDLAGLDLERQTAPTPVSAPASPSDARPPEASGEPVPAAAPASPAPASGEAPDEEAPEASRAPPANVVALRPLQAGRATPPSPSEVDEPTAAEPAPVAPPPGPSAAEGEGSAEDVASDPEPVDDETAFLALGAALRARLDDDAARERPPSETVDAPEPAPPSTDAAHLLEHLPVPILVMRDADPVFANPAAAQRLGFDSAQALLAAGAGLVRESTPAGLVLGDGRGGTTTAAAESTPVAWGGAAAILWTLGPAAVPAPQDDERPPDLIDRVDDAVALLDRDGRIRRLNERGRAWFGDGAVGAELTALLAPESGRTALQLLDEARMRGVGSASAPPRREVSAVVRDGAALPMLLTLGHLGTAGFYATLRDVSALRRAERDEARSRGEREREAARLPDMIARVSHEIRTPLNAILGFAEVMMDERFGPLGSPRYRDYLKDIHDSGTQVVTIVGELLDLSRIEAGRIDLDVAALDVNKVVAEIVAQMQPEANRERVIVRTSLASRIPSVLADEPTTRQIVQHLLSNAVKFNEPGGQVIVSTAQDDGGAVLLRIRDTGVGMTEAEIAAALEPFPEVAPRPANGNGLGLPLARALIGANGASLSIRSRPREGTLVEVSFPPASSESVRRPA